MKFLIRVTNHPEDEKGRDLLALKSAVDAIALAKQVWRDAQTTLTAGASVLVVDSSNGSICWRNGNGVGAPYSEAPVA